MTLQRNTYKKSGFSLLETLVALSIFSLLFLAVAEFISTNLTAKKFGLQLERILRFSDSLLAEAQGVEDARIYTNYSGDCTSASSIALSNWCNEFLQKTPTNNSKEVLFPALAVKTSYTKVVGSTNLWQFKLRINWKNSLEDAKTHTIERSIYLYE